MRSLSLAGLFAPIFIVALLLFQFEPSAQFVKDTRKSPSFKANEVQQAQVSAPQAILHIALFDRMAITLRQIEVVDEYLSTNLPEHRLVSVRVLTSGLFRTTRDIRKEIMEGIRTKLPPGVTISHLVISDHGSSPKVKSGRAGELKTNLAYIGDIYEDRVSSSFHEIFEPIRNRFTQDASIVFSACSTFCGGKAEVANRARALLAYLNAPDGRIYGAIEPDIETLVLDAEKRRVQDFLLTWRSLKGLVPAALMIASTKVGSDLYNGAVDWNSGEALRQSFMLTTIIAAAGHAAGSAFRTLYILGGDRLKVLNRGKILVFLKGMLLEREYIRHVPKNWRRIYNVGGCRQLFVSR